MAKRFLKDKLNISGNTDGATIAAGYVGQKLFYSLLRSSGFTLTSNTTHNIAASNGTPAITLTPGIWAVSAMMGFAGDTGSVMQYCNASLSLTDATLSGVATIGVPATNGEVRTYAAFPASYTPFGNGDIPMYIPTYYVNANANIPLYFVAQAVFTTSNVSCYGSVTAIRIA